MENNDCDEAIVVNTITFHIFSIKLYTVILLLLYYCRGSYMQYFFMNSYDNRINFISIALNLIYRTIVYVKI